jgi:hypothetical protein
MLLVTEYEKAHYQQFKRINTTDNEYYPQVATICAKELQAQWDCGKFYFT